MTKQKLREQYDKLSDILTDLMFLWEDMCKDGDEIIDVKMNFATDLIDDVMMRLIDKMEV